MTVRVGRPGIGQVDYGCRRCWGRLTMGVGGVGAKGISGADVLKVRCKEIANLILNKKSNARQGKIHFRVH